MTWIVAVPHHPMDNAMRTTTDQVCIQSPWFEGNNNATCEKLLAVLWRLTTRSAIIFSLECIDLLKLGLILII